MNWDEQYKYSFFFVCVCMLLKLCAPVPVPALVRSCRSQRLILVVFHGHSPHDVHWWWSSTWIWSSQTWLIKPARLACGFFISTSHVLGLQVKSQNTLVFMCALEILTQSACLFVKQFTLSCLLFILTCKIFLAWWVLVIALIQW